MFFEPGYGSEGKAIFLRDIWPSRSDIQDVEKKYVVPSMFKEVYSKIKEGNKQWNSLNTPHSVLYPWNPESTYVQSPPFFKDMVSFKLIFFNLLI